MKTTWIDGESVTGTVFSELATAAAAADGQYGIPTLTINTTAGAPILDRDTYVPATFKLDGTTVTGGIRGRGNSTWFEAPKKPYRIKLDTTMAMAGPTVPSSKNWAILANYLDQSMVRNAVAFTIGARLSGLDWTPKYRQMNVVLNGYYNGLYQLIEVVRFDATRINHTAASGTSGLPLTGAYLLEIDLRYHDATHQFTTVHDDLNIMLDDPDGTNVTAGAAQVTYITDWINNFETVLYDDANWLDPVDGYLPLIDRDSFIDWYLFQELVVSVDGNFNTSCKLYKTRDTASVPGKLHMGPIWDYDLSMGRSVDDVTYPPESWWIREPGSEDKPGATWIARMIEDPVFADAMHTRWLQIVALIPDYEAIVDSAAQKIAVSRFNDSVIWPDADNEVPWRTDATEIKTWLADRIAWISANIEGEAEETVPPSVPTGLASSSITSTGFTLTWTASTDNVAVTSYDISTDGGTSVATTSTTASKTLTGLTASTGYSVKVRAKDAAGNTSGYSTALSVTTSSGGGSTITVVQTATSSSGLPVTFAAPVTAGNTVVIAFSAYASDIPVAAAPTIGGSTVTGAYPVFNDAVSNAIWNGTGALMSIAWLLPNCPTGTVVNFGTTHITADGGFIAYEIAGLGAAPVVNVSSRGVAVESGSTAVNSGTTAVTTQAPAFVLGVSAMPPPGSTAGAAGFTTTNPSVGSWAGYQIATTSGGSYTWAQTAASSIDWCAGVAALTAAP